MATPSIHGTAQKIFNPETLRSAAKQSSRYLVVPVRLRRAIKKYLRELEDPYLKRKVLKLSQSLSEIKSTNLRLTATTSKELVDDPLSADKSQRWKIKSSYGDIGLKYRDDETVAYVAARMPAVYSACYRVLKEVRRRLPGFSPSRVLDFGAGTGSAFWALREVWPKSLEKVNLVEPSQSMQRAGQSLIQDLKELPVIRSYDSIQALSEDINKSGRQHDLVIASYVLGEIPSLKDRVTTVRQLWGLTQDVLVLVEPGTPAGSNIISQMRSHILWMEKRKLRKLKGRTNEASANRKLKGRTKKASADIAATKSGAFIVAPCPHDGACPLEKSGKYCHFVQRLERTSTQRVYKRSKGHTIRGFEDEKFSYVAIRRGQRPRESWPLDGMVFETLDEQRASRKLEDPRKLEAPRKLEDPEIDYDDLIKSEQADVIPYEEPDPVTYDSDFTEADDVDDNDKVEEEEEETTHADLGGGWGRIIFAPVQRGSHVAMNVCRSTKPDASEGEFQRLVVTKTDSPTLHRQARKSFWGDLWPY